MTTCLALRGFQLCRRTSAFTAAVKELGLDWGCRKWGGDNIALLTPRSARPWHHGSQINLVSYIKGQDLTLTDFHHTPIYLTTLSGNGILLRKSTHATTSQEHCSKCKQPYSTTITFIFSINGCSPHCYDSGKSTCHGKKWVCTSTMQVHWSTTQAKSAILLHQQLTSSPYATIITCFW